MKVLLSVITDIWNNIRNFVLNNLKNFSFLMNFILPFVICILNEYEVLDFKYLFGIIILVDTFSFLFSKVADKIGKGSTVPVPVKRFTKVDEFDEVTIENSRIQELILYMADLEDWLDKKGLFR